MPIDVKCPKCGCELEVPDNAAGKKAKCPDCGGPVPIPSPRAKGPAARAKEAVQERPRRRRRQDDDEEDEDDRPRRRRRRDDDNDGYEDDGVSTMIPYKNGRALASYYCGVFSLIPCLGMILGPVALVFGILGLRYVNENPRAKGTAHAWVGIVLGTLTTLAHLAGIVFIVVLVATGH